MPLTVPFENLTVNESWVFKNTRSTEQWTHGYHRYPAKFLPNIVKKIIEEHTSAGDVIADLFAGCGTTLVESKIHGRESVGVDINPVAELITNVKTNPIDPISLSLSYENLVMQFDNYSESDFAFLDKHERIDYWFFPDAKCKIAFLYKIILDAEIS